MRDYDVFFFLKKRSIIKNIILSENNINNLYNIYDERYIIYKLVTVSLSDSEKIIITEWNELLQSSCTAYLGNEEALLRGCFQVEVFLSLSKFIFSPIVCGMSCSGSWCFKVDRGVHEYSTIHEWKGTDCSLFELNELLKRTWR